jgi:hypothetical protein
MLVLGQIDVDFDADRDFLFDSYYSISLLGFIGLWAL